MNLRSGLVLGGVSLAVGVTTFLVVRSGMRRRCQKKVRKSLDKIPLATDEWKAEQARSICIGKARRA